MTEFDWAFDDYELDNVNQIDARLLRRTAKSVMIAKLRQERASEVLSSLPPRGETWHIVSNGEFDYFSFVPVVITLLGGYSDNFYGASWTISRVCSLLLFELYDEGKIGNVSIVLGRTFRNRKPADYGFLAEGILARQQRFKLFESHAKVILLNRDNHYVVLEGSANFNSNPRVEQTVVSDDQALWEFHREWMETIHHGRKQGR